MNNLLKNFSKKASEKSMKILFFEFFSLIIQIRHIFGKGKTLQNFYILISQPTPAWRLNK